MEAVSQRMPEIGQPALTLMGGGLNFSAHLSVEACQMLRGAKVILRAWCHESVDKWLKALAPDAEIVDIDSSFYLRGQYRPDMYKMIAESVVDMARRNAPVCLVEPGSPIVTDLVTSYTLKLAQAEGMSTRLIPGISSVELILNWFSLDPSSGLQVALAQEFVGRHMRFDRHYNTVILQPGYYDTLWCFDRINNGLSRFAALKSQLDECFAPNDQMALIRFPMHPGDDTHCFWFRLADIEAVYPVLTPLHSLFIPAAASEVPDPVFYERIQSFDISSFFVEGEGVESPATRSNIELVKLNRTLSEELVERSEEMESNWRASVLNGNTSRVSIRRLRAAGAVSGNVEPAAP